MESPRAGTPHRPSGPAGGCHHAVIEAMEPRRLLSASAWAYPSLDGLHLLYQPTAVGDRIIDFSGVGYRDNRAPIPDVPAKLVVRPAKGDDRDRIQRAISRVGEMPIDPVTGFRGAVKLARGTYQVRTRLKIEASGIVLRGAGDGRKGTRLLAMGDEVRPLINVNPRGRSDRPAVGGPRLVTDQYVPAGARTFHLDRVDGLGVGDRIVVRRPSTAGWLAHLGMDRLEFPWLPGTKDIDVERTITRIEGRKVTIDDPLTHGLDLRFGGGTVHKGSLFRRLHNIGIEDLRGDSQIDSPTDRRHAELLVHFAAVENAWLRRATARHFTQGAMTARLGARSITIEDVVVRDPSSPIDGNLRYAFNLERGAEKILVRDVLSVEGRHDFVTDGGAHGPNVFVDAVARDAHAESGPHMHYATGMLFDNVATDHELNVRNRGDKGTNHGWAAANHVIWNSSARGGFRVRNPPGAQNWLIGGAGRVDGRDAPPARAPLPNDPGTYDSVGRRVNPRSLYYAQLKSRTAHPDAEDREYWAGDIDGYIHDGAGSADDVPVDPKWRSAVKKRSGSRLGSLDREKRRKRWIPFSFEFELAAGERVVSASVSMGLKRIGRNADKERIHIDSLAKCRTFKALGWDDLSGVPEGRVLDLHGRLKMLQDGLLNIAIGDNIGVDWAILHLRVVAGGPGTAAALQSGIRAAAFGVRPIVPDASDGVLLDDWPRPIYD